MQTIVYIIRSLTDTTVAVADMSTKFPGLLPVGRLEFMEKCKEIMF